MMCLMIYNVLECVMTSCVEAGVFGEDCLFLCLLICFVSKAIPRPRISSGPLFFKGQNLSDGASLRNPVLLVNPASHTIRLMPHSPTPANTTLTDTSRHHDLTHTIQQHTLTYTTQHHTLIHTKQHHNDQHYFHHTLIHTTKHNTPIHTTKHHTDPHHQAPHSPIQEHTLTYTTQNHTLIHTTKHH